MVAAGACRGAGNAQVLEMPFSVTVVQKRLPALPTSGKLGSAAAAFLIVLVGRPGGSLSWLQTPLAGLGQALWPWPCLAEAALCSQCAGHTFTFSLIGSAGLPFCPLGVTRVVIFRDWHLGVFHSQGQGASCPHPPHPE